MKKFLTVFSFQTLQKNILMVNILYVTSKSFKQIRFNCIKHLLKITISN